MLALTCIDVLYMFWIVFASLFAATFCVSTLQCLYFSMAFLETWAAWVAGGFCSQNYSHLSHLDTVGMEFPVERSVAGALEGVLHVCGCEQVGKFWRNVCKLHGNVQCHVLGFSFLSRCFG